MARNKPRPPSVETSRADFEYQLDVARRIVGAVMKLEAVKPTATNPLHTKHVTRIAELAFMGAVASWEGFLEGTLVRYMAGAKSKNGYAPALRLGPADTISHAYDVLSGEHGYDPAASYMTWTSPSRVISLVKVFLKDGAPFADVLTREQDRLKTASKLRNRIAHGSDKSRADFLEAANRVRNWPLSTKLPRGTTVGSVLLEHAQSFFGKATPARNINVFSAYMDLFASSAQRIAPR
jgi:hypothetical protein